MAQIKDRTINPELVNLFNSWGWNVNVEKLIFNYDAHNSGSSLTEAIKDRLLDFEIADGITLSDITGYTDKDEMQICPCWNTINAIRKHNLDDKLRNDLKYRVIDAMRRIDNGDDICYELLKGRVYSKYHTFKQTITVVDNKPLFSDETPKCMIDACINHIAIKDLNIECSEIDMDEFKCNTEHNYIFGTYENIFETIDDTHKKTLVDSNKLYKITIDVNYKLPYYVPCELEFDDNGDIIELDFESWWCSMLNVVRENDMAYDVWKDRKNNSAFIKEVYKKYKKFILRIDRLNPFAFVENDFSKIENYCINTYENDNIYNDVDIFDNIRVFEYNEVFKHIKNRLFNMKLYQVLKTCYKNYNNNTIYHLQKERNDKGKNHKGHNFEYTIDGIKYEFDGKLENLIQKLKDEIIDCPKSINTIKKKYSIRKSI